LPASVISVSSAALWSLPISLLPSLSSTPDYLASSHSPP
jgi:hypothetical protein